ncbi:MAG TPA: hypothetical protein VHZ55_18165 [Bryobacteraceae bacterium]|jgi:YHS domain-containing protein|nr:hypothetical protein [Bryobacteraceae bacterium]
MRAIFEFLMIICAVFVARAVITSIMQGIARASSNSFPQGAPDTRRAGNSPPPANPGGELHKDPVCGTYVAESAAFRRQVGTQTFYYCSENCREKHSLVAR